MRKHAMTKSGGGHYAVEKVLPKNRGEGILSEVGYTTSKYGSHSI
jgi:hypothetical protein